MHECVRVNCQLPTAAKTNYLHENYEPKRWAMGQNEMAAWWAQCVRVKQTHPIFIIVQTNTCTECSNTAIAPTRRHAIVHITSECQQNSVRDTQYSVGAIWEQILHISHSRKYTPLHSEFHALQPADTNTWARRKRNTLCYAATADVFHSNARIPWHTRTQQQSQWKSFLVTGDWASQSIQLCDS